MTHSEHLYFLIAFLFAIGLLGSEGGGLELDFKIGVPGFDNDWVSMSEKSCSCCFAISIKSSVLPF